MAKQDVDTLARKIVSLEKRHAALARAQQLPSSSVRLAEGEDVMLPSAIQNGEDAYSEAGIIGERADSMGDLIDSEVEYGTYIPDWIENSGHASDVAWDSTQFATDLALQLETELGEAQQELEQAQIELTQALADSAAALQEAQEALQGAEDAATVASAAQTAAVIAQNAANDAQTAASNAQAAADIARGSAVELIGNPTFVTPQPTSVYQKWSHVTGGGRLLNFLGTTALIIGFDGTQYVAEAGNWIAFLGPFGTITEGHTYEVNVSGYFGAATSATVKLYVEGGVPVASAPIVVTDGMGSAKLVYKYEGHAGATPVAWVGLDVAMTDGTTNSYALFTKASALDITEVVAAQERADEAFNKAVAAAIAAGNAQVSADGKNTNWFQNDAPAGTSHKVGDTWFDTNDGNKLYRWNGSNWTTTQFGTNAISDTAINAAKLANNAVTEAKILNGAITNDKLNSTVQNAITTAQSTATNAQTVANNAQTAANAAQTAASNAQDDADQAIADALAAANAASAADGKAVAAQNTANAKGKVIIQSAAPATADRLPQNLWIDTTGGANTPKRWNGSNWVAVTDKAATDAAAAAVTAQTAANAAQTSADDAHTIASGAATAASAAASAASAAQTAANNAQTTANGKNRVVRSTTTPSGTGFVNGDQWWRYNGTTVIGFWIYDGSTWQSQLMGTDAIAPNAVTAAKLADNAVTSAKVAADAITDVKLAPAVRTSITTAQSTADNAQTIATTAQTAAAEAAAAAAKAREASGELVRYPDFDQPAAGSTGYEWVRYSGTGGQIVDDYYGFGAFLVQGYDLTTDSFIADAAVTWRALLGGDANSYWDVYTILPGHSLTVRATVFALTGSLNARLIIAAMHSPESDVIGDQQILDGTHNYVFTNTTPTPIVAALFLQFPATDGTTQAILIKSVSVRDTTQIAEAQAAADAAAVIASAAQSAADAAQNSANAAQSAAEAAQTTANGKNKIVRSTSAASGTGYIAGDQWWRYNGSQIIAMWIYSGSAWVSQTLTDSVITNLDAGSITAGTLNAARIGAASITGTHIAGATITAANMVTGTITAASGIIADAAIGSAKIINGAITTAKIGDAQITNAKIANLDAGKITTGYLAAARIEANTITGTHIAGATVTAANMAVGTITAASGIIADAAIGTAKIIDGSITSAKIDDLAVTNAKIANGTIQNAKIANLDAAKINTGTLNAARIGANTISTQKLLLTSFENLAQDYSFEYNSSEAWQMVANSANETTNPRTGSRALRVTTTSSAFVAARQVAMFSVAGGERYRVSAWVRLDSGTSANNGITLRFAYASTEGGSTTSASDVALTPTGTGTTYAQISGIWTVPAAAKFARLEVISRETVAGKIYRVDDVEIYKMATGELIVDGAITATKISTGAVVADKIASNAVTAVKINTGAVTADKLAANAVTAGKIAANAITTAKLAANAVTAGKIAAQAIDGMTITGALIRTAPSGQRMQFDVNGLHGFDSSGIEVASLEPSGDGLTLAGQAGTHGSINLNSKHLAGYGPSLDIWGPDGDPQVWLRTHGSLGASLTLSNAISGDYGLVILDGGASSVFADNYRNSNGGLSAPYAMASGRVVLSTTGVASGNSVSVTVTLPAGRFTEVPNISGGVSSARLGFQFDSRSTSSFRFLAGNFSGAAAWNGAGDPTNTIYGFWQAVQMTKENANG